MEFLEILLILFPSIILHEYAHGWAAWRLGDPTAKLAGRLTLNPLKHIDPFGTIILPAILLLMRAMGYSSFILGWAKPVPVNFLKLRHPRRDTMLVGAAGPAVNIILAIFFAFLFRMHVSSSLNEVLELAIAINLLLALFNLIPIPPLDGSRLVAGLLPNRLAYWYSRLEGYGIFIVMILLYLGVLRRFIFPMMDILLYYLTGVT